MHNSKIEWFMPGLILISGLAFQNQSKKHCIAMPLAALYRIEMKTNQRSGRMGKPEGNYQGRDMAGDTSVAEGLQGRSGMPRRRRLGGSTRGSKTHRSGYGNGDDLPGLIVQPSVILWDMRMKLSMKNETATRHSPRKMCNYNSCLYFLLSQ